MSISTRLTAPRCRASRSIRASSRRAFSAIQAPAPASLSRSPSAVAFEQDVAHTSKPLISLPSAPPMRAIVSCEAILDPRPANLSRVGRPPLIHILGLTITRMQPLNSLDPHRRRRTLADRRLLRHQPRRQDRGRRRGRRTVRRQGTRARRMRALCALRRNPRERHRRHRAMREPLGRRSRPRGPADARCRRAPPAMRSIAHSGIWRPSSSGRPAHEFAGLPPRSRSPPPIRSRSARPPPWPRPPRKSPPRPAEGQARRRRDHGGDPPALPRCARPPPHAS